MVGSAASINPGNSPGTMTFASDVTCGGCTINIEIGGATAGVNFDFIDIRASTFSFGVGSNILFSFIDSFVPADGDLFEFLGGDTVLGFSSIGFSVAGLGGGYDFAIQQDTSGLGLLVTSLTGSPVSEPNALAVLCLGLAGIGFNRRNRLSSTQTQFHYSNPASAGFFVFGRQSAVGRKATIEMVRFPAAGDGVRLPSAQPFPKHRQLRCQDTEPCFQVWYDRATTGRPGGSSFAGR